MRIRCFISTIYNMSGRVVSDIQTRAEGESLYIRYNTDANCRSNFKNKRCLSRENQSWSLCKSTWICITYTDSFTPMISFVFSSWVINEFFNFTYQPNHFLCTLIRDRSNDIKKLVMGPFKVPDFFLTHRTNDYFFDPPHQF
jgi:hypothetical protein